MAKEMSTYRETLWFAVSGLISLFYVLELLQLHHDDKVLFYS